MTFLIGFVLGVTATAGLVAALAIVIGGTRKPYPQPQSETALALALKWAQIREDFAPDEFELLRRIDRQMAGVEAAVIRDWQDRPYDHEREGL